VYGPGNKLARRLILIVLALAILLVGAVLAIAIVTSTEALRSLTQQNYTQQHTVLQRSLENRIDVIRADTAALAEEVDSRARWSRGQLRALIARELGSNEEVDPIHVHFYRAEGQSQIYNFDYVIPETSAPDLTLPLSRAVDLEDVPADAWIFDRATQNEPSWFGPAPALFGTTDDLVMSLAYPLSEPDGLLWVDVPISTFGGPLALFAEPNTDEIGEAARPSEYVLLLNSQQQVIAQHNVPAALTVEALTADFFAEDMTLDRISDPLNPALNVFLIADNVAGTTGWRLITVVPDVLLAEALSTVAVSRLLLITALGTMLLAYVVQRYVRQSVALPLSRLSRAAQQIGDGDMRYTLRHQDRPDEIGQLARALDSMKISLAHNYDELTASRNNLERRVQRRTQELDTARQQAQATANELRAVYDESLLVVSAYQLQTILQTLVQRIYTLLEASYTAVWLISDDGTKVRLVANTAEDKSKIGMQVALDTNNGLVSKAINQEKLVVVDDYPRWTGRSDLEVSEHMHQAMAVPLIFSGKVIGGVIVGRVHDAPFFEVDDQRLLRLFANLVSPAVRNAQLFVQRDRAVKEAQRANEVKTRFLASVTHELRTPLNLVINNMDFMRIGVFGDVTDEQKHRLDQTTRSAEHLLHLINDLLDVSKIEAGEMSLSRQETDLYTLLEDAIASTEVLLEQYGKQGQVALVTQIDEDIPRFPMDARRVRQVLVNLLSNAVKFTDEGQVLLRVTNRRYYIRFDVIDTGVGVAEDELDALFEAFERTRSAKENAIEGTGLGLPICKFLVEAHGGRIEVNSTVGEGTTFTFTLPTKPKPDSHESQQMSAMLGRSAASGDPT